MKCDITHFILTLALCIAGCETPVEFRRNNPHDAGSADFSPKPATDVTADFLEDDILKITWKNHSDFAEGFSVERKVDSGGYAPVQTLDGSVSSAEDTALVLGVYTYRVRAQYKGRQSDYAYSNSLTVGNWAPGPAMNTSRGGNPIAVRLGSGTIVVHDKNGTEILTPGARAWNRGGAMVPNIQTWSVALNNTVILSFGYNQSTLSPGVPGSSVNQWFDAGTGLWQQFPGIPMDPFSYLTQLTPLRLAGGNILIVGSAMTSSPGPVTSLAFIYDAVMGTFRHTGSMSPKLGYAACVLADGRVLVTGSTYSDTLHLSDSCFVFDPASETWSAVASFHSLRYEHISILLDNGKVLIAGGQNQTCELYSPASNTWSYAASLDGPLVYAAEKMSDERVFALYQNFSGQLIPVIYSPGDDRWTSGQPWPSSISFSPLVSALLPSNRILLTGANTKQCMIFRDR